MADAKVLELLATPGLVTESRSVTVSPPARVPLLNVIDRTVEAIAAVAAGAPAVGVITVTAVEVRTKAKPVNVIMILPELGMEFKGVSVTVIMTGVVD